MLVNVKVYKRSAGATVLSIFSAACGVVGISILFGQFDIEGAGRYIGAAIVIGLAILFSVLANIAGKQAFKNKIKTDVDFALSVWRENPQSEQELINANPNILPLIKNILEKECRCEKCGVLYPKTGTCIHCGPITAYDSPTLAHDEVLDIPARITIIREKSLADAAMSVEYMCNGEVVGKLWNGQSVTISTNKSQNLVGAKKWKTQYDEKLIYCTSGSHIGVHFVVGEFSHTSALDNTAPQTAGGRFQKPPSQASSKFCKHCGASMSNDAMFCGGCGAKVQQV